MPGIQYRATNESEINVFERSFGCLSTSRADESRDSLLIISSPKMTHISIRQSTSRQAAKDTTEGSLSCSSDSIHLHSMITAKKSTSSLIDNSDLKAFTKVLEISYLQVMALSKIDTTFNFFYTRARVLFSF